MRRNATPVIISTLVVAAACAERSIPRDAGEPRRIEFDVSEGSWMSVDVAPDGETLIFDLVGHIYELPITGGTARPLTTGQAWHRAARYSPDGTEIAMVRDGSGPDEVWIMPAEGGEPRRITDHSSQRHGWVAGSPSWSPDGGSIFFGSSQHDFEEHLPMWRVELATGEISAVEPDPPSGSRRTGVLSPDGRHFYFSELHEAVDSSTWRSTVRTMLVRLDLETQRRTILTDTLAGIHEFTPQLSDDGRWLSYVRRDRSGRSALRVRELAADAGGPPPLARAASQVGVLPSRPATGHASARARVRGHTAGSDGQGRGLPHGGWGEDRDQRPQPSRPLRPRRDVVSPASGCVSRNVIRAGTLNGAEKMGLDHELGSLEAGKVADILVLEGNPLEDIINTVAQKYVVADGVVYDVMQEEILLALPPGR